MVALYDGFKDFHPKRVVRARSVDEVSEAVLVAGKSGEKIRPMGLGYSWAEHCFTNGLSVQMNAMRHFCQVDPVQKTVTVDAGVRMGDVTRALALHALCLPSLAFLPEMTAGGAVATATHGTNHESGTMSDFVLSLDIVLASGEVKTFSLDRVSESEMRAARVSIGMLGIITRVTFQAIAMPWVRYTKLDLDLTEFMETRDAILAKFTHVWAHWTLGSNRVSVDCLEQKQFSESGFYPYVSHRNAVWEHRNSSPIKSAVKPVWHLLQDLLRPRMAVTKQQSKTDVRISMQYAIGRKSWEEVVKTISASDFAKSSAGKIMEMKFVKGNNLSFLGPNASQDAVCFNVYWMVPRLEQAHILRPFEEIMRSFFARPHWGKDHRTPNFAFMKEAYPDWGEFNSIRKQLDKQDIFMSID